MKKKYLILTGLMCAWMGAQPVAAQTDVTAQYLVNPSFEILKASDGTTDVALKTTLSNGLYGWTVAEMSNYQVESYESGSATGFPADGKITAADGTNYYYNRQGWSNKDSELRTVTSRAVPAGWYYLDFDYKAADYSNLNDASKNGTTIGVKVLDANSSVLGETPAVKRAYSMANNSTNPGADDYLVAAEWTKLGVCFEVKEPTMVTVVIQQNMRNNGRSDIAYDNLRLYSLDAVTEDSPLDFTGLVANPAFATRSSVGWTLSDGIAVSYEAAEYFNRDFNITQTINGLPNGIYEVQVSAFYRTSGSEKAVLYGNDDKVDIKSLYDEKPEGLAGSYTAEGYANNMQAGSACFAAGYYVNKLDRALVTNSTLKFGVQTENHATNSWCMFDSFKLVYKGFDTSAAVEALRKMLDEANAMVEADAASAILSTRLSEKIETAEAAIQIGTAAALDAATLDLQTAMDAYNIVAASIAILKAGVAASSDIFQNSFATKSDTEAYKKAVNDVQPIFQTAQTEAEVNAAIESLEAARQTYVLAAQPKEGYSFDLTFKIVNAAVASTSGWSSANTSSGQQYDGAPDNTYLDIWNATINARQSVSGLPEGGYTLKAATRASTDVTTGNIYVEADGTTFRTDIHRVGSAGNDLGNGWGWTVVDGIQASGSLTIGFYAECGNNKWAGADDFHLSYSGISDPYAVYDALRIKANGLLESAMYAGYRSVIAQHKSLTQDASRDDLLQAIFELQAAVADAEVSIAAYAYLQRETATAKSFGIDVTAEEAAIADGSYDNAAATSVARRLNVDTYNKVKAGYGYEVPVDNWTGSIGTAASQHWSGAADRSYYDTNGTDITASLTTAVTLPAGEYVLMAAGRSHAAAKMELKIDDENVTFTAKGDVGYGIETDGQANFSADGTYANDGQGRGWEWEFVHLNLTEEKNVALTATITTSGWAWGSFSDITLKMDQKTFEAVYYKKLQAALEACKPWTAGDEYADVTYPKYETAYNNKAYTSVSEIETAINALQEAFDTYSFENITFEHPYDMTSWIVNPDFVDQKNGWESTQNSTNGYKEEYSNGKYAYTVVGRMRHATVYQILKNVPVGTYRLTAKMSGEPNTDESMYLYATTGTVDHWSTPVFSGYAKFGYYTTKNQGAEKEVEVIFNITETSDVRIGALSWGANVDSNKKGSMTVDEWRLEKILYAVRGDAIDAIVYGAVPTAVMEDAIANGVCSFDMSEVTNVSNMTVSTEKNPNILIYAKAGQVTNIDNVVVDGVCASLKLADGHPFSAPVAFNATKASYTMSSVAVNTAGDGFGTLCLPFEVTTLAGEAYKLDQGVTVGGELYAAEAAAIPANTPVLVKAKGEYAGSNVEVSATKSGAVYEAGELVGVYSPTTAPLGSYVLQKHGDKVAFYLVGEEVQPVVNPFRAYIRPQAEAASLDVLSVVFGFGDETAVGAVEAAEGVSEMSRHNAAGVQIARPQKGINIVRMSDGSVRKVMVK